MCPHFLQVYFSVGCFLLLSILNYLKVTPKLVRIRVMVNRAPFQTVSSR
ncbi:hypothetical protein FXW30_05070 [Candidatus Liberibacter asiaticus]|nr:hypothetical protein FXW22_05080 [Candidatus Liberibacter asiaticus]KAE9511531.1 hypothetical protein FXW31_01015 [Candidatus Liberibacter asiaticus]KAE9511823.1 hypothetical protein FXW32_05065 [Candidatus Liberibacter asiaticus]KAE9512861.1 hypothetical protein FXW35_05110 [Candidatus Liberibacter asiaticus]KAE9513963.1 hypothetical protein FXW25_04980 [Candidatus Liberibacter asiaticus]